jgi:hypothetical protein
MAWLLIRTFLITPLVFLVAAPILLLWLLHASLPDGRTLYLCARSALAHPIGRPEWRLKKPYP